jgi:hypothetical protein
MKTETLDEVFLREEIRHATSSHLVVSDDSSILLTVVLKGIQEALVERSILLAE